jgi:L-malate glycosyltransferase
MERRAATIRVLHVVATSKRRGAEIFAADLATKFHEVGLDQAVAVLRGSHPLEIAFDCPVHLLMTGRRRVPGLRIDPTAIWALRRLIGWWRPDVVQAHGGEALKHSVVAAQGRPVHVIYRKIGAVPPWITRGVRRLLHRELLRRAACIVAVADSVRRDTVRVFGVHHVVTIPNAVDSRRMLPAKTPSIIRSRLGIRPSSPVLLSLGALTWEKDPLTHLDVSRRVAAEFPEVIHLMVGDGPMRAEVRDAIRDRALEHVRVLGSRDDVADILSLSDVLLFASRPDGMEGMPAVLIEAGMMGVPIVGYDIVGVSEVVIHEQTGVLVPYSDVGALVEGVLDLLRNPARRRSLGTAAKTRCRSQFDIGVVAKEYLETYRRLPRRKSARKTGSGYRSHQP